MVAKNRSNIRTASDGESSVFIDKFLGLNNKGDPVRLKKGYLVKTDNIDIDDEQHIRMRDGFSLAASFTDIYAAYSTRDEKHLYMIDNGDLVEVASNMSTIQLATGLPDGEYHWTEAGNMIFFSGPAQGVIENGVYRNWGIPTPDQPSVTLLSGGLPAGRYQVTCTYVASDGREGGAPAATVVEAPSNGVALGIVIPQVAGYTSNVYVSTHDGDSMFLVKRNSGTSIIWDSPEVMLASPIEDDQIGAEPPPIGELIAFFMGKIFVSQYFPDQDYSVIWSSKPYWYDLFNLSQDYILVPGRVNTLLSTKEGMIIGTGEHIITLDLNGEMDTVADYGTVPGQNGNMITEGEKGKETEKLYFWSTEGVCEAFPFRNLTEEDVSVPPGARCATAVVDKNGYSKFVVLVDDSGTAFNDYQ